jgi:heat shock protein beta
LKIINQIFYKKINNRWFSSHKIDELTSLDEYLSRAKPGQDNIYFIAGESKE